MDSYQQSSETPGELRQFFLVICFVVLYQQLNKKKMKFPHTGLLFVGGLEGNWRITVEYFWKTSTEVLEMWSNTVSSVWKWKIRLFLIMIEVTKLRLFEFVHYLSFDCLIKYWRFRLIDHIDRRKLKLFYCLYGILPVICAYICTCTCSTIYFKNL